MYMKSKLSFAYLVQNNILFVSNRFEISEQRYPLENASVTPSMYEKRFLIGEKIPLL